MNIAVIRYNAGNIQSVAFALDRAGVQYEVTGDPEKIMAAEGVIFPGVGEAKSTMAYLHQHNLDQLIRDLKQPTLGICLGMQLLCSHSEENDTTCLGVFDAPVKKFRDASLKIPHMGWNSLEHVNGWLDSSLEEKFVYFVHSYYVPVNQYTVAQTRYGNPFSAALQKNNFFGVQFHPEKSADAGERVIQSFLQQVK